MALDRLRRQLHQAGRRQRLRQRRLRQGGARPDQPRRLPLRHGGRPARRTPLRRRRNDLGTHQRRPPPVRQPDRGVDRRPACLRTCLPRHQRSRHPGRRPHRRHADDAPADHAPADDTASDHAPADDTAPDHAPADDTAPDHAASDDTASDHAASGWWVRGDLPGDRLLVGRVPGRGGGQQPGHPAHRRMDARLDLPQRPADQSALGRHPHPDRSGRLGGGQRLERRARRRRQHHYRLPRLLDRQQRAAGHRDLHESLTRWPGVVRATREHRSAGAA
ncbi:hypothetical protein MILUP08_45404 [Micromonospora lupini str. Lupac 08]|uniref:Uncharacterized protein n=1 Tax=Micromonospora lupini str. Lupac 08 TaxID=1150864 RepID=I0L9M4_9ACTN|nr:hypothetical protein MILUP08_45404 [Micromonospora lupini str. Lupac 08]